MHGGLYIEDFTLRTLHWGAFIQPSTLNPLHWRPSKFLALFRRSSCRRADTGYTESTLGELSREMHKRFRWFRNWSTMVNDHFIIIALLVALPIALLVCLLMALLVPLHVNKPAGSVYWFIYSSLYWRCGWEYQPDKRRREVRDGRKCLLEGLSSLSIQALHFKTCNSNPATPAIS